MEDSLQRNALKTRAKMGELREPVEGSIGVTGSLIGLGIVKLGQRETTKSARSTAEHADVQEGFLRVDRIRVK